MISVDGNVCTLGEFIDVIKYENVDPSKLITKAFEEATRLLVGPLKTF